MNLKYGLFLIICAVAAVAFTLKFGPKIVSDAETDASLQIAPLTSVQGDAILKELAAIRTTLENIEKQSHTTKTPTTPSTASVSIENQPVLGNADAKVTVVEFTDYQCPYCRRFMSTTYPGLKREYIDTGKVRWVVRDLPLSFHKQAQLAATAVHCAGEQDRFWEFRDMLFQNQSELMPEQLQQYARQSGLDAERFKTCLNSSRYQEKMERDAAAAAAERISGTPTFVIGTQDSNSIVSGKRVVGAQSYAVFRSEIERLLQTQQLSYK